MNRPIHCLALALLALHLTPSFARSAVDLDITGRITPQACTVLLSDSGLIDYGKIPARTLNPTEFTVLPSHQMGLSISCEGAILFALTGIDNQAESSLEPAVFFGLGMNLHALTERLGRVSLSLRGPVGDGATLQTLASADNGATWAPEANVYPRRLMAFALPGVLFPGAWHQLVASLRVDTAIRPANALTLKEEVPLDGSITLDLKYL